MKDLPVNVRNFGVSCKKGVLETILSFIKRKRMMSRFNLDKLLSNKYFQRVMM